MHNGNGRNGAREAVILGAVRTPFGKRGGHFSQWHPVEMLSFTLKGLMERTGIDPALVPPWSKTPSADASVKLASSR
jgi:acetyl-CoA acetyltransferase